MLLTGETEMLSVLLQRPIGTVRCRYSIYYSCRTSPRSVAQRPRSARGLDCPPAHFCRNSYIYQESQL